MQRKNHLLLICVIALALLTTACFESKWAGRSEHWDIALYADGNYTILYIGDEARIADFSFTWTTGSTVSVTLTGQDPATLPFRYSGTIFARDVVAPISVSIEWNGRSETIELKQGQNDAHAVPLPEPQPMPEKEPSMDEDMADISDAEVPATDIPHTDVSGAESPDAKSPGVTIRYAGRFFLHVSKEMVDGKILLTPREGTQTPMLIPSEDDSLYVFTSPTSDIYLLDPETLVAEQISRDETEDYAKQELWEVAHPGGPLSWASEPLISGDNELVSYLSNRRSI